jgi:hypothetical protein
MLAWEATMAVEQDRIDAERYRWIRAHCTRTDGSGEKFDLPKFGVLEFVWHRIEYRSGKPHVLMELDSAVDAARGVQGTEPQARSPCLCPRCCSARIGFRAGATR